MHKIRLRQATDQTSVNFFFNFNHTAGYKLEWDLNLPVHGEERVFLFGGPFVRVPFKISVRFKLSQDFFQPLFQQCLTTSATRIEMFLFK